MKQHGGNIWVYSEPGSGTSFEVYLPVMKQRPARPEKKKKTESENRVGSENILVVEDDERMRKLVTTLLIRQGYNVICPRCAPEAFSVLKSSNDRVSLLLTDVVMPAINGKELYEEIAEQYPDIKVLYISGYTDDIIGQRGILEEGINFIEKPFSSKTLAAKVREVLDQ